MRSLSFFLVLAMGLLANCAALRAGDIGAAVDEHSTTSAMPAPSPAGKSLRLAASPMPQEQEAGSSHAAEAKAGGTCANSGYTCSSRYPYCCYSEAKGYYCRQDARHC